MERIITFDPAYDKRNTDPKKNYGIHGVDLSMILKGKLGVVQFILYTNWHLPDVWDEQKIRLLGKAQHPSTLSAYDFDLFKPLPADLGYHSPKPMYKGQRERPDCPYLDGKPCYCDGSALNAHHVYEVLLRTGSDGVWKVLEEYYTDTFGELK